MRIKNFSRNRLVDNVFSARRIQTKMKQSIQWHAFKTRTYSHRTNLKIYQKFVLIFVCYAAHVMVSLSVSFSFPITYHIYLAYFSEKPLSISFLAYSIPYFFLL